MQDQSYVSNLSATATEILLPNGYELAYYTLRRGRDGHLQCYQPINASAIHGPPVQAIPIAAPGSDIHAQGSHQHFQDSSNSNPWPRSSSTHHSPYHTQTSNRQLYNIPIRGGRKKLPVPDNEALSLSATTQKRHAHLRDDDYTDVCGVVSQPRANPVKRYNPGKGEYCCPICGSNYTRPKSVKDHFPSCVSKCGNPQGLRYTDHASMAHVEATKQRRAQTSRAVSDSEMEEGDGETEGNDQRIKSDRINDALYVQA